MWILLCHHHRETNIFFASPPHNKTGAVFVTRNTSPFCRKSQKKKLFLDQIETRHLWSTTTTVRISFRFSFACFIYDHGTCIQCTTLHTTTLVLFYSEKFIERYFNLCCYYFYSPMYVACTGITTTINTTTLFYVFYVISE